jgi:hypothetical protein
MHVAVPVLVIAEESLRQKHLLKNACSHCICPKELSTLHLTVLGIELRTLHLLDKHSTTRAIPPSAFWKMMDKAIKVVIFMKA